MKEKLSTKKALYLYGIILGFVFVFYLAALHFGTRGDSSDVEDQVEFYDDLSKPLDSDKTSESTTKKSPPESNQNLKDSTPLKATAVKPPKDSTTKPLVSGRYTVQVGAFSTENEARQMVVRLRTKNFNGRIQQPFGGADKFFRVWIGEFKDKAEALEMEDELKRADFLTYTRKIP